MKRWIISIVSLSLLVACSNDLDTIRKVTSGKYFPDETATDLRTISTDSGNVKITVKANIMETNHDPIDKTYLKNGLEIVFYNEKNEKNAILTANYGERNEKTGNMFVKDSVVLKNLDAHQQLETEELFWENDSVYSKKAVIVRTKNTILFGKGISANQTFTIFKILHPTGKKIIKND